MCMFAYNNRCNLYHRYIHIYESFQLYSVYCSIKQFVEIHN